MNEINYFPLQDGKIPTSSLRMSKFSNLPSAHQKIFHINKSSSRFLENKKKCRKENLEKYYKSESTFNISLITKFIIDRLTKEYSDLFEWQDRKLFCRETYDFLSFDENYNLIKSFNLCGNQINYIDALDALAMQVPEDIIVCTMFNENGDNYISSVHLCSPSDWSAEWAFKKSFADIHDKILAPNNEPLIRKPKQIIKSILQMPESVERIGALTFRSHVVLNMHPAQNYQDEWFWDENQQIFLRFERQTVTAFPEINSFLFTVRPCWVNLCEPDKRQKTLEALENYDEGVYNYSFLRQHGENLKKFLIEKIK